MPKILIIGATGYIGKKLAQTLVSSGQHRVYGVVRNQEKAKSLAVAEITPVICADPVDNPAPYLKAIKDFHIDVVVDASGANQGSVNFLKDVKQAGQERLDLYKSHGRPAGPKLGFVYCSGMWVHGSSDEPVDDNIIAGKGAPTPPASIVAWRPAFEDSVLASSDVLDVAVVRPALIYGYENTIWTMFFKPLLQAVQKGSADTVKIPLLPNSKPGLIHLDDVASGFQLVIEKLQLINGTSVYPVFDLVTSTESMSDIFQAAAASWGFKGRFELAGAGGDAFAEAMSTSFKGSSDRAKQILGWKPVRLNGMVHDMDIYASSSAAQMS